ncbi:NIPA-like protein 3 [Lunasporangiospora selenospora]|uniref:NIPA-like protein 3 n=1 Tax=Lunasporangiospora selenospora TaxID=979761 RepID=A0A9P6FS99_9FUNG|nr:NIPA-like protein 3 [Lunasporangiospora selenospora]
MSSSPAVVNAHSTSHSRRMRMGRVLSSHPSLYSTNSIENHGRRGDIWKRATPVGMPLTCSNDFDCLQTVRPPGWPRDHPDIKSGNYACVKDRSAGVNQTGTCQFVVSAGELCSVATDCAANSFYVQLNLTTPVDLCSPRHCTLESTCGSPWTRPDAPSDRYFDTSPQAKVSCCGGQPTASICSLIGSNVDTCEYHNVCKFDLSEVDRAIANADSTNNLGLTKDQMQQMGIGVCQKIDQRNHVWIGVIITLVGSTVLNIGLNVQKFALRKHDERRVQKELEMEEEHQRWRDELGWTEEQVQQEADRLYEEKESNHGKLYRKLKPYMFWQDIIVSKLWAIGLLVFIVGNLGGFVALRFAPQSLTAPLGSISLISNVIIAPLINKEVLGRWDIAGIVFIVAGSVIVVVFSGIVAQDYKLCVLINLFHKPATIVYLTFIGVCIIGIYFFIKFVEKNVENEADMAIGVSSERNLQQEGRLHRLHSSQSNLSLASALHPTSSGFPQTMDQGDAVSVTVHADSDTPRPSSLRSLEILDQPTRRYSHARDTSLNCDTIADNSSVAAATVTQHSDNDIRAGPSPLRQSPSSLSSSDSNDTRVIQGSGLVSLVSPNATATQEDSIKGGTSRKGSSIDEENPTPGPSKGARLTFDEPSPMFLSPTGVKLGRESISSTEGEGPSALASNNLSEKDIRPPSMVRSHSMTLSVQSAKRNRRRQLLQQEKANLPLWKRLLKIELIPTLPEDKLIRRNSPLLRFFLPLSYAAIGGMMASYTVLFAKSLINLLVTSIFDGQNQFTSAIAWIILIVTVVTAVSQVYWINMGLRKYDALLQVPVFFTIWVLLDIVGGGIYYGEFSGFTPKKYVMFCLGVLIVFMGVGMLAKRLAVLAREDAGGEPGPASSNPSRRASTVDVSVAANTTVRGSTAPTQRK